MSDILEPIDYEALVLAKLEDAAQSSSLSERRGHLDQAAVFAAKGEAARYAGNGCRS
ncbi:hypothetical protein [Sphingomonas sp. UV9]|uniref:hypothetical protein n=1 Tax=Sphingomonas sp. UV9 TaxID=1851410 RepID=UPI0013E8C366|nr:hypothetical protein [Sphingomonas sp. UV9]